jgi:hypothetical protein
MNARHTHTVIWIVSSLKETFPLHTMLVQFIFKAPDLCMPTRLTNRQQYTFNINYTGLSTSAGKSDSGTYVEG